MTTATKPDMRMIIDCDIAKSDADPSKIVAFSDGTPENSVYWSELTKAQAKQFFDVGLGRMTKYGSAEVGSQSGSEILGALEDLYPDWVAEFEEEAYA